MVEKTRLQVAGAWLLDHELWLVGGVVLVSMAGGGWLPAALFLPAVLFLGLFFWPLRRLITGRWTVRTPIDWPAIILAFLALLNLWVTPVLPVTLVQVERLLVGIILIYALVNGVQFVSDDHGTQGDGGRHVLHKLRIAALFCICFGLALAVAAFIFVDWGPGATPAGLTEIKLWMVNRVPAIAGEWVNPNVMAGVLVIVLPIAFGWLLFFDRNEPPWLGWLLILSTALMGGTILLTQSRGAWLALLAGLLVLVALRWRRGWLASAVILVAILAGLIFTGPGKSMAGLFNHPGTTSLAGRQETWSRAWAVISDFPLTGAGMGAYTTVVDRLYPFFSFRPGEQTHAHNLLLQIGADLGLPGLIAWLAIFLTVVWAAWGAYQRSKGVAELAWVRGLAAGLLATQVALLVHGLVDAVTWGMMRPAPLVWYGWGLAISLAVFTHLGGAQDSHLA